MPMTQNNIDSIPDKILSNQESKPIRQPNMNFWRFDKTFNRLRENEISMIEV